VPYLSALEVCSRRGATQKHVYLYLYQWRAYGVCVVSARDKAVMDPQGARSLGRASYAVSTVGIVVSIIIIAVYFGVAYSSYSSCSYYSHDGSCYLNRSYGYSYSHCAARGGVLDDNYCYYD